MYEQYGLQENVTLYGNELPLRESSAAGKLAPASEFALSDCTVASVSLKTSIRNTILCGVGYIFSFESLFSFTSSLGTLKLL